MMTQNFLVGKMFLVKKMLNMTSKFPLGVKPHVTTFRSAQVVSILMEICTLNFGMVSCRVLDGDVK